MRHNGSSNEPPDPERHDMQALAKNKECTLRGDDIDLIFPDLFPLFGGTTPTPPATDSTTPPAGSTPPAATPPADDKDEKDPVKKLLGNPDAVAALLQQSSNVQSQLTEALAKIQTFEQEKTAAEQAKLGKEEQQAAQITNLEAEVAKRDAIIGAKILENAVARNTQFEWENVGDVLSKIDPNTIKTTIDIDKGVAEVEGVEVELKRIATEFPYLVKKDKARPDETVDTTTQQQQPRQRTSGNPPRPPSLPQDKAARREAVMKKFPTLMAGMTGRP